MFQSGQVISKVRFEPTISRIQSKRANQAYYSLVMYIDFFFKIIKFGEFVIYIILTLNFTIVIAVASAGGGEGVRRKWERVCCHTRWGQSQPCLLSTL